MLDDSVLRTLSSLRGLRGHPRCPHYAERRSLSDSKCWNGGKKWVNVYYNQKCACNLMFTMNFIIIVIHLQMLCQGGPVSPQHVGDVGEAQLRAVYRGVARFWGGGCWNILFTHLCPPLRSIFAVRETASLGIMGEPRVPPLNSSETIVLSEHYHLWGV